jgi:hypothetical protein
MESVATIIPRVMNGARHDADTRPTTPTIIERRRPRTLADLVDELREASSRENPDVVVETRALRLSPEGLVEVPSLGAFEFTDWSRSQCASLVGLRWNRWFQNAGGAERAEEINRRFARATNSVRLRTRALGRGEAPAVPGASGRLAAVVSPTYTAVPDVTIAEKLFQALGSSREYPIVRLDLTDRTSTFIVQLGDAFQKGDENARVGQLHGGVLVRNSGVGFASLVVTLHLTRLLCLNGMTAPVDDALVLKKRHRGLDLEAIDERMTAGLRAVEPRLHESGRRLVASLKRAVPDIERELRTVLRDARLPVRLLQPILDAHAKEPLPNAFGVSQALTLAAQGLSPEERFELERAAGRYLS